MALNETNALNEADRAERDIAAAETKPSHICILEDRPGRAAHLEAALASAPGATALGDVRRLWIEPLETLTCSCGAKIRECGYWRAALIRAETGEESLRSLAAIEAKANTRWGLVSAGFSLNRLARNAALGSFFAAQDALFSSIAAVAGARLLVERTTSTHRAWAMATRPEVRIVEIGDRKSELAARLLPFRTGVARIDATALAADLRGELQRALGPGIAGALDWRRDGEFAPDPNRHAIESASHPISEVVSTATTTAARARVAAQAA